MCSCEKPTVTDQEWLAILACIRAEERAIIALLLQPNGTGKLEISFHDGQVKAVNVLKSGGALRNAA